MQRILTILTGLAVIGLAAFWIVSEPRPRSTEVFATLTADIARGEMVYNAAGCGSCHMVEKAEGAAQLVLSGGQRFTTAFGTFVAPNISPDATSGIGGWSTAQFATAVMDGISPEGEHYFPAMPYAAFGKMQPQDMADLKAFMDTLPRSEAVSLPNEVGFPFNIRRLLGGWKFLFLSGDWVLKTADTPQLERGRYIVEAMAHCGECHTPRNALGGLKTSAWLGGSQDPFSKIKFPNITPGALDWSEADILSYLTTGFTPDFDTVGGPMAHVVDNMAKLPEGDRMAVVSYLKAVKPVPK